jgi:endonuclease YncB( thermonuclease family)
MRILSRGKDMKKLILAVVLLVVTAAPAFAQYAPPPRAAPRTPVNRETLAERRAAPRDVTGQALILDGEKLRIGDTDLRLFGIVPPQLSASFGPQARAALDSLIGGQSVSCHVRDRDHDGRLLATCQAANGVDPAQELLRRGLAVAARGSLADTEFAQPYVIAEQAAQNAKIGLWSMTLAAPTVSPVSVESPKVETPKAETPKTEAPKAEAPKVDAVPVKATEVQPKTSSATMVPVTTPPGGVVKEAPKPSVESPGFFARFQILITGLLMLATSLSIFGALTYHRRMEKRDELKSLAAALRGELLAARAVCQTRIKSIVTEEDDRVSVWPRIRSTLYQAYVGRLGGLGAELARQIASIYGQASDYASYYNSFGDSDVALVTPKRQALQSLVSHIEEVLPRLAGIEQTGERTAPNVYSVSTLNAMPAVPEPVIALSAPKAVPATGAVSAKPASEPVPAAVPVADEPSIELKLRNAVRNLRERFIEPQRSVEIPEESISDYTALIEEEIERYSYGGDDDSDLSPLGKLGRH